MGRTSCACVQDVRLFLADSAAAATVDLPLSEEEKEHLRVSYPCLTPRDAVVTGQDRAGVRYSVGATDGTGRLIREIGFTRVRERRRGSVFALVLQVQGRESGPSGRWGRVARRDSSVGMPETAVLDSCGGPERRRFRRNAKVVVFLGINRSYILYTSLRLFLRQYNQKSLELDEYDFCDIDTFPSITRHVRQRGTRGGIESRATITFIGYSKTGRN